MFMDDEASFDVIGKVDCKKSKKPHLLDYI